MRFPGDIELRSARPGDEPAIAALVSACDESYREWAGPGWEPPPPGLELARWRGRLTDGSWWTRVATERGERVVGIVCFTQAMDWSDRERGIGEPIPGRAHIAAVFIHPDRWREGIAESLMAVAEESMRAEGYREVQLWTPRGAPARRFYEATGWHHDGREQWLDELAMPIVAYVKDL